MPPKTPLLEKIIEYFLDSKFYIKLLTSILLAVVTIWIFHNYPTITNRYIPNAIKFIITPTQESIIVLFISLVIIFFCKNYLALSIQNLFSKLTSKYFMLLLAGLAIVGASAALFIPSYTNWFRENDSTKTQQPISTPQPTQSGQAIGNQQKQESKNPASELRGHLLYITGGVIAVLGLIETNRKNSQEHIRQVHATRRERYIEAVDKLSSEQAPVRLGGVYALVGLVDEWLEDDNIDKETQIKEGQIIINNLCSYIRSPFPLAEKIEEYEAHEKLGNLKRKEPKNLSSLGFLQLDFLNKYFIDSNDDKKIEQITADYAKFHEEQDVRRTIFVEMSKRSSTFIKKESGYIYDLGKILKVISGTWSDFDFDFSRAPIFYPLDNLTIERGNFASAKFYNGADFEEATFTQTANFSGVTFNKNANFKRAAFAQDANFNEVAFTEDAIFERAIFTGYTFFEEATFTQTANFSGSNFCLSAFFNETTFAQTADFSRATFTINGVFEEAIFTQTANFSGSNFCLSAFFEKAIFTQTADFSWASFTHYADFSAATFIKNVIFNNTIFKNYEPTFAYEQYRARFSVHAAQEDYNFSVRSGSKPIPPGEAELDEVKRQIPVGAALFDLDSGRISEPAKPIEESDNQGETPSK